MRANLDDIEIYIGSDHAGFELKSELIEYIDNEYYNGTLIDVGCRTKDSVDYPDIARSVVSGIVASGKNNSRHNKAFGILICGTGQGMSMSANTYAGIRACVAWNEEISKLSREHNNANVLCLPARHITSYEAKNIVNSFFSQSFSSEERHIRRVNKI